MPGIIPPGKGIAQLQKGYDAGGGTSGGGSSGTAARPAHALSGWHAASTALAVTLPRELWTAAQLNRATLLVLSRRSRIRH